MASASYIIPRGNFSDNDNDPDASYDMADCTMSRTSAREHKSKSKGRASKSEKVDNMNFEDAFIDPAGVESNNHENQNSVLSSWISKLPAMQRDRYTDAARGSDSTEKMWLEGAEQTTGGSDADSVISNDSGLGNQETQTSEHFTDLQLDADLQSVRTEIQIEVEALLQTLDNIQLNDETVVPREISVQLRRHSRSIASIFGDNVVSMKSTIKHQNQELQKMAEEHAAECVRANAATNETIFKLGQERNEQIKRMNHLHFKQLAGWRDQCEGSEERHQKQMASLNQKIEHLRVDKTAFRHIKEAHEILKLQLEAAKSRISSLESTVQQCQDSQACAEDELASAINCISRLRDEKAVNDAKLVDCVQEARDHEEERDAALFENSELWTVVDNLKKEIENAKKRDDEISRALEHEEKAKLRLAELAGSQRSAIEGLRSSKNTLLKENQTLKLRGETLSQKNNKLGQENYDFKQKIKAFYDKRAVEVAKLANIRDKLEAVSTQFDILRKERVSQRKQSKELRDCHLAGAKARLEAMNEGAFLEARIDISFNSIEEKAEVMESFISAYQDKVQRVKDENGTHAIQERAGATTTSLSLNGFPSEILGKENAALKDKVSQLTAQLGHASINTKCSRDALAERNAELNELNAAKEKDNWVLREALVTALTKVETLGEQLRTHSREDLFTARGETLGDREKVNSGDEEPVCLCSESLTNKLEFSAFRNHMSVLQKQNEGPKKEVFKTLVEKAKAEKERAQRDSNISHLQKDASLARQHSERILKHA